MIEVAVIVIPLALLPLAWRTLRRGLAPLSDLFDLALAPWGVQAAAAVLQMGVVVALCLLARACGLSEAERF